MYERLHLKEKELVTKAPVNVTTSLSSWEDKHKSARKSLNLYQRFGYQPPSTKQCNKRENKTSRCRLTIKMAADGTNTQMHAAKNDIKLWVCSRNKTIMQMRPCMTDGAAV